MPWNYVCKWISSVRDYALSEPAAAGKTQQEEESWYLWSNLKSWGWWMSADGLSLHLERCVLCVVLGWADVGSYHYHYHFISIGSSGDGVEWWPRRKYRCSGGSHSVASFMVHMMVTLFDLQIVCVGSIIFSLCTLRLPWISGCFPQILPPREVGSPTRRVTTSWPGLLGKDVERVSA